MSLLLDHDHLSNKKYSVVRKITLKPHFSGPFVFFSILGILAEGPDSVAEAESSVLESLSR